MSEYDDEDDICQYTQKIGTIKPTTIHFDDHSLLGANYLRYKPEKIIIWTSEVRKKNIISGIQTFFRDIIDNKLINSGKNIGSKSELQKEITIKPDQYLVNCRVWTDLNTINKIYLKTNKGIEFEFGDENGEEKKIDALSTGNKIIISFFGSYDQHLETFGLHLIEKKEYLKVLFTGYFELKAKLKKDKYKEEILQKLKDGKYKFQEEVIIRTCLLPDNQFNEIMKFCII